MPRAEELDEVAPGIFIWEAYDSKVKADLFSTALETDSGTWVVDPIPLTSKGLVSLQANHPNTAGIFVTNANHARAAARFARTLAVPVYVHNELRGSGDFLQAKGLQDGETFSQELTAIAIDGGPAGEMALHYGANGGTMVVGDALINFEPLGFGLLPAKYCLDSKLMRRSLEKILGYSFERMLFAHGTPILSGARARLDQLLGTIR
jgi:Metallo-beta-lactamase superfamily